MKDQVGELASRGGVWVELKFELVQSTLIFDVHLGEPRVPFPQQLGFLLDLLCCLFALLALSPELIHPQLVIGISSPIRRPIAEKGGGCMWGG